jgi:hypothetical protein
MPVEVRCNAEACPHNNSKFCAANVIFVKMEEHEKEPLAVCKSFELATNEPNWPTLRNIWDTIVKLFKR